MELRLEKSKKYITVQVAFRIYSETHTKTNILLVLQVFYYLLIIHNEKKADKIILKIFVTVQVASRIYSEMRTKTHIL